MDSMKRRLAALRAEPFRPNASVKYSSSVGALDFTPGRTFSMRRLIASIDNASDTLSTIPARADSGTML